MRFTSENVVQDIQAILDSRNAEVWNNIDRVLLKAKLHIESKERELAELEKEIDTYRLKNSNQIDTYRYEK